jgi:hypothetical protein
MSAVDEAVNEPDDVVFAAAEYAPKKRRRWLRLAIFVFTAQYTITAIIVGSSVATVLHYLVTPQIVAQFEAISAALKH